MKRLAWQLAAVSSLFAALAHAASRPQYGGTAHLLFRAMPGSLDPVSPSAASDNLLRLIYDTLVFVDDAGNPQPGLALSWQAGHDRRHWHFQLRAGVKFDDGSLVSSELVAASLRQANPWAIYPRGDSIDVDLEQPDELLPVELSLPRNAVVKRNGSGLHGTGPFRVEQWVPGKRLLLNVNEDYWGGRPFLNSVEIEFGKSYREQEAAMDLGPAEIVEIAPEQVRHMETAGRHIAESEPTELMALVFARDSESASESKLRDALALCIDRATIRNVLLQGNGEPAGGILPNWISGYQFLFPSDMDLIRAQELRGEVNQAPVWTLASDPSDSLTKVIAERIVLNARDAGLRVQVGTESNAELRLVRVRLQSANAAVALKIASAQLGLPEPNLGTASAQNLYEAEAALLKKQKIIPLFHLPVAFGIGAAVKGWQTRRDGTWQLPDVWLREATSPTN